MKKYVYRIYYANETLNCEKYPVIYENEQYIYYKTASKSTLNYVSKTGNWRCSNSIKELHCKDIKCIDRIVLKMPTKDEIQQLMVEINKNNKERRIADLLSKINNAKEDIKKLEKEFESIK